MTNHPRTALVLALSAAAVAASFTVARADHSGGGLAWGECAPGALPQQQCATLSVPRDYSDPDGPRLSLAVSRIRSERPEARRGTLMVIPGGPGSSGVQRLTQKGEALAEEMDGAYDLVAFDPRGVGGSTTASCGLDENDRRLENLRSWPAADGSIDENVSRSRRTAEACRRDGGETLHSFTTANQVRDLDRLRQALGEEKISAWGVSYGAYVGAVYAQKYPRHTDRWVLDSSGDPDPQRVAQGWMRNMARGAEDRFPDFAAWAAHPDRAKEALRLARHAEDVRPLFLDLAARLDRVPKESTTPGTPVSGNILRQALQNALYSDSAFPALARMIVAAGSQDPAVRPALPPGLDKPLSDESLAVTVAVVCNDVRWSGSVRSYERAVAADRARHPLTAGLPANITPCSFWRAPAEKPARITDDGPSNILMTQSLRDPATPYAGGLKMRAALGDRARLVTVEQGGHGNYLGNGNACADRTVTEFLRTGVRPARDVSCAN
ncbi:alpha/beta fold hydrolase [Streptomyces sp. ISL-36]|uniref:alpha/beta hydrolase n=1 Tax=Streptomyces sp. ISL-36 TaxID=2819182 RepID=UPI001BEA3357|nr:alpha/beta hydrolase [Streptomyces sp. ISL-36]MBT2439677.1 alpha/beta fold hydrolase [Streptomyces sp. ISL-36]